MVCIVFTNSFVYTDLTQYTFWMVSANTRFPKEALTCINLMHADSTRMNLLSYEIVGILYIDNPPGGDYYFYIKKM